MDTWTIKREWLIGDRRGTGCKFQLFAKLMHRYRGFYSHLFFFFCSPVIFTGVSIHVRIIPHVSFRAVCSILVLQHFKWSSTHKWGRHPGEEHSEDSQLTTEKKELTENSAAHFFFSRAQPHPREKDGIVGESGEKLGNDVSYFSHSGEH